MNRVLDLIVASLHCVLGFSTNQLSWMTLHYISLYLASSTQEAELRIVVDIDGVAVVK